MRLKFIAKIIAVIIALGVGGIGLYNYFSDEITISIVGDILLSRNVKKVLNEYGKQYPYEKIKGEVLKDDITIANLECALTDNSNHALKKNRIVLGADRDNATYLKRGGIDVVSLANNHTMDYLPEGLQDTVQSLNDAKVGYVGVKNNSTAQIEPYIVEKKGIKVGVLGYNTFPPEGLFYSDDDIRVLYARIGYLEDMKIQISDAKKKCDFLIVYFHFGSEYYTKVSEEQKQYARTAVDSGADFVVGSHPHLLQGMEIYNDVPIYYSLGSCIFDDLSYPETNDSIILQIKLSKNSMKVKEIPIVIENCRPQIAWGNDKKRILQSIKNKSNI